MRRGRETRGRTFHRSALVAGILALACGTAAPAAAGTAQPRHAARTAAQTDVRTAAWAAPWIGTWEAAPTVGLTDPGDAAPGHTVRNVVHVSAGGVAVRLRLSNRFGTAALDLGHVTVAVQAPGANGPEAQGGTMRAVTFRGAGSALVPPHADVVSDPVPLRVRPGSDLLLSTYLPDVSGPVTAHTLAMQTSFYAPGGDHAADTAGTAFTGTTSHWDYVTGVDVFDRPVRGSVVALGDSITDGYQSTAGADHRWPDYLARRMRALPPPRRLGVLNAGISGNRLLLDGGGFGINALARLDEDVLSRSGVRTVIVLEGINDIQQTPHQTDPAKIEAAYREIVRRARAHGLRVVGGTLTPFEGWAVYDDTLEATREAVNAYIRDSGLFDAVVDFDAATRDPADPRRMLPAYDSGDHLHPNDAGYRAMAAAIDLHRL